MKLRKPRAAASHMLAPPSAAFGSPPAAFGSPPAAFDSPPVCPATPPCKRPFFSWHLLQITPPAPPVPPSAAACLPPSAACSLSRFLHFRPHPSPSPSPVWKNSPAPPVPPSAAACSPPPAACSLPAGPRSLFSAYQACTSHKHKQTMDKLATSSHAAYSQRRIHSIPTPTMQPGLQFQRCHSWLFSRNLESQLSYACPLPSPAIGPHPRYPPFLS